MGDKPLADAGRVEFIAEQMRQHPNAEAWVARRAHTVMSSSFDQVSYPDAAMDAWVLRTHKLMRSSAEVARCRRKYLTPEERLEIEAKKPDPGWC